MRNVDELVEVYTRQLARWIDRRGFLARLGGFVVGIHGAQALAEDPELLLRFAAGVALAQVGLHVVAALDVELAVQVGLKERFRDVAGGRAHFPCGRARRSVCRWG